MEYKLNGCLFTFDEKGFLTGLQHGNHVFMSRGRGLFDLAQPVAFDWENIRMQPDGAAFQYDGQRLTVTYARLGADFACPPLPEIAGGVEAQLTLCALPDGRSISLQLRIVNHAEAAIRQVMFPFFKGLDAVDSEAATRLTTLGFSWRPFEEMRDIPERRNSYFAKNLAMTGRVFKSRGYMDDDDMIGRWYDYGSLKGGFSLYHRWWGFGPDNSEIMGDDIHVRLMQRDHLLWIGGIHPVSIAQEESWQSSEYIFTPHEGGWVQGIGPYEEWVNQNKKRVLPPPKAIGEDIGLRTVWMAENYPCDPESIAADFEALPQIGRDMREHGLRQLSLWGAQDSCLPLQDECFTKELGGVEGFRKAVAQLREMGVDPSVFVSWVSIWRRSVERYGLKLESAGDGWAQNIKAIPSFRTPYMNKSRCAVIHQDHPLWQQDVAEGLAALRDRYGVPTIGWDQVLADPTPGGVLDQLIRYRQETAEKYQESVVYGESCFLYEADINILDYTWDWAYFVHPRDPRAYTRVVRTTRPNINIDNNPLDVKRCFADNLFMNVMPSKSNSTNGSALICEYPELSHALKCAMQLRKRYLAFFTEGDPVGDCVLSEDCSGAHVSGYTLGDRTLAIVWAKEGGECCLHMPQLRDIPITEAVDFDTLQEVNVQREGETVTVCTQPNAVTLLLFG